MSTEATNLIDFYATTSELQWYWVAGDTTIDALRDDADLIEKLYIDHFVSDVRLNINDEGQIQLGILTER